MRFFAHCAAITLATFLSVGLIHSQAAAQQNSFGDLPPLAKPATKPDKKERLKKPAKKRQNARRKKGVTALFNEAQNHYKAGKYGEAIAGYDQIIKRFPSHQPSIVQMAKSFYRLDRMKDAYAIFARVNPAGLDAESSYEYGWSFYKAEQWQGALYGFARVPKGHALFDLANYYGGICAIRLRNYEAAEEMLERAVVLPDKLSKSRQLYLKYVATLQLLKQKSELDAVRRKERELLAEARKSAKDDSADKDGKPVVDNDKHKGKKSVTKDAKVGFSTFRQTTDYHGFKEETYDVQLAQFSLYSGVLAPLPVGIKERKAAFGLQLMLKAEDRNAKGAETRVIIDETNDDLTRVLAGQKENQHSKSGIVSAEPWFEFPLPEDVWLAVGGELYFTYGDFERQNRSGTRKAYVGLAGEGNGLDYTAGFSYQEVLNTDTLATTTILEGLGSLAHSFEHDFAMKLNGSHKLYDYLMTNLNLNGPDSLTAVVVSATQGLPWGFGLAGETGYLYQGNHTVFDLPRFGQVSANGQTTHIKLALKAAPAPWFSASIEQLFQMTQWDVDPAEVQEVYELNVPNYLDQFTAAAALNLSF